MKKRQFGLIGYPLKHSFSPGYFAEKYENEGISDAEYKLYELEEIAAFSALKKMELTGLNVTIPYKEKIIPYLDELSAEAKEIGAVNTIKFADNRLIGYNTDTHGFTESLRQFYGHDKPSAALVLGSGGACKAVCFSLDRLGIRWTIVSRRSEYLNYENLDQNHFEEYRLIVNTTPLGTWPDIDTCPAIPYDLLTENHFLYDLVYNPEKTLFLKRGEEAGAAIKNGHDMLKIQAEKAWEIWNS